MANAKVTVTNTDRNQVVRIVTTDPTGSYSIPIIPVGTYAIKVEATGFKAEDRTGVILNVSDDLRINFKLQVGSNTETDRSEGGVRGGRTRQPRPAQPPSKAHRFGNWRSAHATTSNWSR